MIHQMLLKLADEALRKGMEMASQAELRGPLLVLQAWDGEVHRYHITMPNVPPYEAMKVILDVHRALHAAICLEGWAVLVEPPPPGPERDAFEARARTGRRPPGMPQPKDHPDRRDVLVLMGQSRGTPDTGDMHVTRQWFITNGRPRTFAEDSEFALGDQAPSNFWPMYGTPRELHAIAHRYAELGRLASDLAGRRS
jgi:hypothetical protein